MLWNLFAFAGMMLATGWRYVWFGTGRGTCRMEESPLSCVELMEKIHLLKQELRGCHNQIARQRIQIDDLREHVNRLQQRLEQDRAKTE